MTDTRAKLDQALTEFAVPGNRWSGTRKVTYWGAACGMDADEVIELAHGVGVSDRDADIRRGMASATEKVRTNAERFGNRPQHTRLRMPRPPVKRAEPEQTDRVRRLIDAGRDVETDEGLVALSPAKIVTDTDDLALRVMGEMQMLAMFARTDLVRIRTGKTDNTRSLPGKNLKPLGEWLERSPHPVDYGEIVRINPLTGEQGKTKAGAMSYDAQACVASFRHVVMEFDNLPREDQRRFWAGFIRRSPFAQNLICLVDSGGKSIHGVLRVDAPDEQTWMRYRTELLKLYATDPDVRYRLDEQAMMPLTGCRLAGARRADTGRVQMLLYVTNRWRDVEWQDKLNPKPKRMPPPPPPKRKAFAMSCNACPARTDCVTAFGSYWAGKSHGGIGCAQPFAGWAGANVPKPKPAALPKVEDVLLPW